jgi:transposase
MAKDRMPIEKFLPLYMKAVETGLTKEEFASKIGVLPATVYQRVYELRHDGLDIPLLKSEGRVSKLEKAKAILAELRGGAKAGKVVAAKPKPVKKEVVVEVVEEEEVAEEPTLSEEQEVEDELSKLLG